MKHTKRWDSFIHSNDEIRDVPYLCVELLSYKLTQTLTITYNGRKHEL